MQTLKERIVTPYGVATIDVSSPDGQPTIERRQVQPALPEGMTVDGVELIEIVFASGVSKVTPITFSIEVEGEYEPASGEHLECITCDTVGGWVSIATRDREWFEWRHVISSEIEYSANALSLTVTSAPTGYRLPLAIAWRAGKTLLTPERELDDQRGLPRPADECATWFAVDLAMPYQG